MISWIQRNFKKHFNVVFLIVLAGMAIPLIAVFNPSSGGGRAGNKILSRSFYGINLENAGETRRVFADSNLSAQLKAGYASLSSAQLQQYTLQRIAGLALADELHLPVPTPDQVARYVPTLRAFQDKQGEFDQARYTAFADSIMTGGQFTTADVNRVLRDDTRLEALAKIVGGPGYVLPGDVKQQLIRADSRWTVHVATLGYAAFKPAIAATDDVLKKFYDDNRFRYEVPPRPRLSRVEFKNEEFTPAVAPTEAELRDFYTANSASFPVPPEPADKKDAAPPPAPAPAADNFSKVRAKVEIAWKDKTAARDASKAANDFTIALFERKLAANSPELAAFLAAQHRPAAAITPFAPDNPPQDMPWLADHADQISRLSRERYFSDPLPTANGLVVLLWNESLPAYTPLFSEVRERVAADYTESEKRKLFMERGQAFHQQLQAAVKSSATSFSSAATAEKLEVKSFADFTLRQPPPDMPPPALNALLGLSSGQVSDMVTESGQGYLVFVQEKKLPDLSPANPRYAECQKQLMAFGASLNGNSYFGELVERELKKTKPITP